MPTEHLWSFVITVSNSLQRHVPIDPNEGNTLIYCSQLIYVWQSEWSSCKMKLNRNLYEKIIPSSAWWQLPAVWCLSANRSHWLSTLRSLIDFWDDKSDHRPHSAQKFEWNWVGQVLQSRWLLTAAVVVYRLLTNKVILCHTITATAGTGSLPAAGLHGVNSHRQLL